jgi:hypothetical protein
VPLSVFDIEKSIDELSQFQERLLAQFLTISSPNSPS